jgi:hypothetical protein
MSKQHLNAFSVTPRSFECLSLGQLASNVASLLVEFLDGNLFPGHESPPSLPCRDRDSEIPVMINDGGD